MKKWLISGILIIVLALVLPGAFAEENEESIYDVTVDEELEYNGYLVHVESSSQPRISLYSVGVEEVVDDLYLAESIEDIQRAWDEDEIVYIEPNYGFTYYDVPNDPYYKYQWDMEYINAPEFWDTDITADGVRIAILDTGLMSGHPDIDYNYVASGYNFVKNSSNVTDIASDSHGTAVAGIICAIRNNSQGMAGLLEKSIIVPMQVFDGKYAYTDVLVRAIRAAVDVYDCDVINMSLGIEIEGKLSDDMKSLTDAIDYAAQNDVIMVAAAGNSGTSAMNYPAGYDSVIGVGATDENGDLAYFSQRNSSVFVTAPGYHIVSLKNTELKYEYVYGTSFSAPYVTAMAAAAKAVRHDMTIDEFKQILQRSVTDKGTAGYDTDYGYGIIDLSAFVAALPESNWVAGFRDITYHWAKDNIAYVVELGLFNGTTTYTFDADIEMSRAMFVTVLGRLYELTGGTISGTGDSFTDTENNVWYSSYVSWASENGIIEGYGGGIFAPNDPVKREQAATIMARFAQYLGMDVDGDASLLSQFVDGGSISEWAMESVAWTVEQGLINGIELNGSIYMQPDGVSSRAQVATIMSRFASVVSLASAA